MADSDQYSAFFVDGPMDGMVLGLPGPMQIFEVRRIVGTAVLLRDAIASGRLHPGAQVETEVGLYERTRVTRDTVHMNVALYEWRGWPDDPA